MTSALLLFLVFSMAAVTLVSSAINETVLDDETAMDVGEMIFKAQSSRNRAISGGDDIKTPTSRNAVPCTRTGCKWPKTGRYVYVPVSFSSSYTTAERRIIILGLVSFHSTTCIRFVHRQRRHRNYIHFYSGSGCWSYLGRQSRGQYISLRKNGCLHHPIVQHEALHALGFHHEQVRSDRNRYVRILFGNIIPAFRRNFWRVRTNNLRTPYDFSSVMQYSNFAFSRNGQPTIVARSNPSLRFGFASQMSTNDIKRVNTLYQCS